jgi:hypothetical protein
VAGGKIENEVVAAQLAAWPEKGGQANNYDCRNE